MLSALPLIVVTVLLAVDLWVYSDASAHVKQGRAVTVTLGSLRVETPSAWFAACLILSVVFIPIYLAARTP
jgi:hypothetical protein